MKALLILNGEIKDLSIVSEFARESDFILCADGAADYCFKTSLLPDMVIGDLDSISKDALIMVNKNNIPVKKFPIKKNATDGELSVEYLIGRGFKYITILGAIGNRVDHSLANILLLRKLNQNNIKGKIVDGYNIIYLIEKELKLEKQRGSLISLIPIACTKTIVTLEGFEYKLNESEICFGSTLGISNRIVAAQGHISVHEGECLVIISKD